MSQCWKCTLETSVFGPISQRAVAKCLSCSNKCLFFCKLLKGKYPLLLEKTCWTQFQNFNKHTDLLRFYISQIYFLSQAEQKRNSPHLSPTMDSKVDSRLIKSVVFRPWLQWRGLIEWRYVILGQQKPPWPLVLIHPAPSHTYISMPYNLLQSFISS